MQKWNREFADAKEPAGVIGPLHVDFVREIERERLALASELIKDDAIVNATYRDPPSVEFIVKLIIFLNNIKSVYDSNSHNVRREKQIRQRLLLEGIDLKQHHVFRVVIR